MDKDYFKSIKILDGGMGQLLLEKGMISMGTLWSASALLDEKYHQILVDAHLSYINAGSDIIVTNTFSCRKYRLIENNFGDQFAYLNETACKLAIKAKETSKKNVFIAGSIPSQRDTYITDKRNKELILSDMLEQARIINDYVDFLYLDVISSINEVEAALNLSEKLNKKILIGIHLKKNGKLPSNENLKDLLKNIQNQNLLGVICACVSPEISIQALDSFQGYGEPFGFKANLWKIKEPGPIQTFNTAKPDEIGTNPNVSFGIRDDVSLNDFYNFSKIMKDNGATILGGCCETTPEHIKKISKLK